MWNTESTINSEKERSAPCLSPPPLAVWAFARQDEFSLFTLSFNSSVKHTCFWSFHPFLSSHQQGGRVKNAYFPLARIGLGHQRVSKSLIFQGLWGWLQIIRCQSHGTLKQQRLVACPHYVPSTGWQGHSPHCCHCYLAWQTCLYLLWCCHLYLSFQIAVSGDRVWRITASWLFSPSAQRGRVSFSFRLISQRKLQGLPSLKGNMCLEGRKNQERWWTLATPNTSINSNSCPLCMGYCAKHITWILLIGPRWVLSPFFQEPEVRRDLCKAAGDTEGGIWTCVNWLAVSVGPSANHYCVAHTIL